MKPSSEKAVICGHVKLIAPRSSLKTFPRFEEIGKATCHPSGPRGKKESGRDRAIDRLTGGDRSDQMQVRYSRMKSYESYEVKWSRMKSNEVV